MTQITITLNVGINYISFPATSINNFQSIFTSSGILANIISFKRFNAILQQFEPVDYNEYIIKGAGYYISVSSQSNIIYGGTEYTLSFDELKDSLIQGWNLVGTGTNNIELPLTILSTCKIIDPITNLQVTLIETKHSYWINYDDCMLTSKSSISLWVGILGLGISILYLIGKTERQRNQV